MNRSNFNQTGGFPLDTERLQELQTTFSLLNSLGMIAGERAIITGCTITGTQVSAGVVVINGEVLEFRAGTLMGTVIIIEEPITAEFENGEVKPVHYIRYARFGAGPIGSVFPWSGFKRIVHNKDIQAALDGKVSTALMTALTARVVTLEKKTAIFQPGGVAFIWNKPANEIPVGFAEVTDLKGRTIFGFDAAQTEFNLVGKTGGTKNKALSINEMPAHTHNMIVHQSDSGNGSGNVQGGTYESPVVKSGQMQSAGGGQSFSILNPYRVVMFIEWIG